MASCDTPNFTGPPGESPFLAVNTSTPVSVTSIVCSTCRLVSKDIPFEVERRHTELCRPFAIDGCISPLVWPIHILVFSQSQDRLDSERHSGFAGTHSPILTVMGNPWRWVKFRVDAMSSPSRHDATAARLRMRLDNRAKLADQTARFDQCDGEVQTLPRCLDESDGIRVCAGFVPDIVSLIHIGMVSSMIDRYIKVDDITVSKLVAIRDSMADDFVD